MNSDLGCVIDKEFRKQLECATSQTPLTIIATIRNSLELDEAIKAINITGKEYRRSTPEQQQSVHEAEAKMMEPVCRYLDGLSVQYSLMKSIHIVSAQMTPSQVLEFIKQPYVHIICPNSEVRLVE